MSTLEIHTSLSVPSTGVSSQLRHLAGQHFAELKISLLLLKASGSAELKQHQAPEDSFSLHPEFNKGCAAVLQTQILRHYR